ncbi:MAG: hypothetical protein DRP71_08700 [Verrucomicrobia bacterium]|nr:MAG: hypothetical protein DRP71_08700 [Verrucomicrobiota bacterium]
MPGSSDRRRFGAFAVALFLGVSGLIVGLTDWDQRLSSRVLDLLPASDDSLERRFMIGVIQDEQADLMRFVITNLAIDRRDDATDLLREMLRDSRTFEPTLLSDQQVIERAAGFLFKHRMTLLFPTWLARHQAEWRTMTSDLPFHEWLAVRTVEELDQFLTSPDGFFFSELIDQDPLLLIPQLRDGAIGDAGTGNRSTVLTARLRHSAFDPVTQANVLETLTALEAGLIREFPGARILATGPVLFARHSRAAIRAEVGRINIASILLVIVVVVVSLRNPLGLIGLVPVVACGLTGGLIGSLLYFGQVHVMMLVLGAFLSGITVDYGFHTFLSRPGEERSRLWKPLSAAAGSTAVGFIVLMFGSLPVVRQLGFFVGVGALCALFAALSLKPVVPPRLTAVRPVFTRPFFRGWIRPWTVTILLILLAGMTTGIFRIVWHDDIRELDMPSPELSAVDCRIREIAGDSGDRTAYLTTGPNFLVAIDRQRGFQETRSDPNAGSIHSLATVLPTIGELHATRDFLGEGSKLWLDGLRRELDRAGYDPFAFGPFFETWAGLEADACQAASIEEQLRELSDLLIGPVAFLLIEANGIHAVGTLAPSEPTATSPGPDPSFHTIAASQLENLNHVFSRYRSEVWRFVLYGLLAVTVAIGVIYRPLPGLRILLVPTAAVFSAFGLLGWTLPGLNLFHLLAGLLGFCLSLDYSLFAWESRRRGESPPASVRVSALTTLAAFGVLATSRLPAVASLGITVALIVLVALVLIEVLGATRPTNPDHGNSE